MYGFHIVDIVADGRRREDGAWAVETVGTLTVAEYTHMGVSGLGIAVDASHAKGVAKRDWRRKVGMLPKQ
jgi:hypothetical protein